MQFSCFSDERILWLCGELINSEGHIKSKSLRETHAGQEAGLAQPPTGTALLLPACIAFPSIISLAGATDKTLEGCPVSNE